METVIDPQNAFSQHVSAELTDAILSLSSDIVLYLSPKGIIRKVIVQNRELSRLVKSWVGKSWKSCVTTESELKIDQLLRFSNKSLKNDSRHVNHHLSDGGYLPVSYATLNCEREGFIVAVGRELSQLTALQQKLVSAQQTLERDYVQLRHVETRYRSLFNLVETPVLVCKADSTEILEINPAAIRLLNCDTNAVIGKKLDLFFGEDEKQKVNNFLIKTQLGERNVFETKLANDKTICINLSSFRQENETYSLIQFQLETENISEKKYSPENSLQKAIGKSPDALVICDIDGKISYINEAFLELTALPNKDHVSGSNLMTWLARGRVDFSIMRNTLQDSGVLKLFTTQIIGQSSSIEVEISGIELDHRTHKEMVFSLRNISRRIKNESATGQLSRSAEQLSELVGQLPLKNIVNETTDLIEKLCIEAALDLSLNNRVSAAEMLGLSRQSLYVKMKKLNIQDGGERS